MLALTFSVENAEAIQFAAAPTIGFQLRITNGASDRMVQSVALRCQLQIEAARRQYSSAEKIALQDLFGEPDRWRETLRSLLWTHVNLTVPSFDTAIQVEVPVPCTFDFNVAAAKYFHAAEHEDVPVCFQFSGSVFYSSPGSPLQIAQIGWDREARFRLPANVWHTMMDLYYPNSAWLRLRRDVFESLNDYKQSRGLPSLEDALESLLIHQKGASS